MRTNNEAPLTFFNIEYIIIVHHYEDKLGVRESLSQDRLMKEETKYEGIKEGYCKVYEKPAKGE